MTDAAISGASASNALEAFDLIELLRLLSQNQKTGVLRVHRGQQFFGLWLSGGKVRHMSGANLDTDAAAFAHLLQDPRGRFQFEDGHQRSGEQWPEPTLNCGYEAFVYAALKLLPPPELKFVGTGRLVASERFAELDLNFYEQEVLRGVAEGKSLGELSIGRDPQALALLARLCRLHLISERRSRMARLIVQVSRKNNRQASNAAVIDDSIYQRWRAAAGGHIEHIQVKDERSGKVHQFKVIAAQDVGTFLQLPPELLLQKGLRGGDSVLVRPV